MIGVYPTARFIWCQLAKVVKQGWPFVSILVSSSLQSNEKSEIWIKEWKMAKNRNEIGRAFPIVKTAEIQSQ